MTRPRKHGKAVTPATKPSMTATSDEPRDRERAPLLDEDRGPRHGHDDRPTTSREDDLLGTSSSHTTAPDSRNEEPFGELTPGSATEGGDA